MLEHKLYLLTHFWWNTSCTLQQSFAWTKVFSTVAFLVEEKYLYSWAVEHNCIFGWTKVLVLLNTIACSGWCNYRNVWLPAFEKGLPIPGHFWEYPITVLSKKIWTFEEQRKVLLRKVFQYPVTVPSNKILRMSVCTSDCDGAN